MNDIEYFNRFGRAPCELLFASDTNFIYILVLIFWLSLDRPELLKMFAVNSRDKMLIFLMNNHIKDAFY